MEANVESQEDSKYQRLYSGESKKKPVAIVLSRQALENLKEQADSMGIERNDLIRQIIYRQAFKDGLAA